MLGYVTIGALDGEKSIKFYDAVLGAIGYECAYSDPNGWTGYGPKGKPQNVFIVPPYDGQPARPGNGIMVSFLARDKEQVHAAYQAGLQSGGSDEGAPGPRPPDSTTFYGAYLRDPTGNKICVFAIPRKAAG